MKGTLFSADFVKDNSGNYRLLELNTDTGISANIEQNINLDGFFNVLSGSAITTLHMIYKPYIHNPIVEYISSSAATQATFITDIVLQPEDANTIYPTSVEDASDKFILRMAYDESAILDSTYAKNRLEVFKLFTDEAINDYTPGYYYSSSTDGVIDTLEKDINSSNIPDAVIKDNIEQQNPLSFYKIGSQVENETNSQRWDAFVSENANENQVIEQYYNHPSSVVDNRFTSARYVGIVYGLDLDVLTLGTYKSDAIFELPTDISSEVNSSQYTNKLSATHYYEYTTNFVKNGSNGVLESHKIIKSDGTSDTLTNIAVGDSIQSYFISGSPQVESDIESSTWQIEGSSFPSGSYITSSEVVFKEEKDLKYGGLVEVVVDSDSVFVGVGKQFLVYDSGSNVTRYKSAQYLDSDTDYFFDTNANLIDIDQANFYVTPDSNLKLVELDVEDTDTYIISGSTSFHSIVTHNAPCFVEGTNITLADGTFKSIEEVKIGEEVLTYNFKTNSVEPNSVRAIGSKKVGSIVSYEFEDGSTLKATLDHPLYCNKHGWVSMNTDFTSMVYNLSTSKAQVGCEILKQDKTVSKIKNIIIDETETIVYNLRTVEVNHNFFANEYLVHNRGCFVAGTEIILSNGDVKNIEDIKVGESVLTYNQESGNNESGVVGDLKTHEVQSVIRLTLDNEIIIITTHEHPFYTQRGWVKAGELESLDVCKKSDGSESLVSTVEVLDETHTVYNLLSVSENNNFYANNILVHNKL